MAPMPLLELLRRVFLLPDSRGFLPTMLEIAKILRDIDSLGRERADAYAGLKDEFARADEVMRTVCADLPAARERIRTAKTSWLIADFDEAPDKTHDLPGLPPSFAVVAVDGSQIMPDKHEVTLCYLLNSASVILYYGTGERPIARTNPLLHYRDEDLCEDPYGKKRVSINEKLVGMKRTLAESAQMEEAIRAAKASGIPVVALWDGSLIRWALQSEPEDYRKRVLEQYLQAFDTAKDLGIPIAGYISDPGSRDFVNSMRIMLCDRAPVDCDLCAHRQNGETAPCDAISRLNDSAVLRERLAGGRRSVLFTSASSILDSYREHRTLAFYMDSGREIARIEVPEWVGENPELLDLIHAACFDQAQKGRGYPVALAEAHEHAVVRAPERAAFFAMIEHSLVKHGAKITHSLKRLSKGY